MGNPDGRCAGSVLMLLLLYKRSGTEVPQVDFQVNKFNFAMGKTSSD